MDGYRNYAGWLITDTDHWQVTHLSPLLPKVQYPSSYRRVGEGRVRAGQSHHSKTVAPERFTVPA